MKAVTAAVTLVIAGCDQPLPMAGRVTADNAEQVLLSGAVADGAVGDYFLQNDHVVAIIQRPGRVFSVGPYGGNVIDFGDRQVGEDQLGETIPFIQFGLTANFDTVRVIDDGSAGGAAVIEAEGTDALWDFLTLQTLTPLLRYETNENGFPTGLLKFDPSADLPLRIRARYKLAPDARHIDVRYYLRNTGDEALDLRVGFTVDMRGTVEPFSPGRGFTEPGVDLDELDTVLTTPVDSPFLAYQADGFSIGVRSLDFLDGVETPRLSIAVVGIAMVAVGVGTLLDLLGPKGPFVLEPNEERGFGFQMLIGRDVNDVKAWAQGAADWGAVRGHVVDGFSGASIAGARVAALDPATGDVINAWVTKEDGSFGGGLPPGTYHVAADDVHRYPDVGRPVVVVGSSTTDVTIELAPPAIVHVQVQSANRVDDPTLAWTPCRIALLGEAPPRAAGLCRPGSVCADHEPFRHAKLWELDTPVPTVEYLRTCNTAMAPDAPLTVPPGQYLAVVSRGPEYDTVMQVLELGPNERADVTGVLHRAVNSEGFAATDFHIHQVRSPDSVVPYETRVESFAAVAIDFFATTDHDSISDLRPLIDAMGLESELTMVPGSEVSTMDLGHFNGFPFEPIPGLQDGGPVDWAGGRRRPTPPELFELMRARGARVVQVNHPRSHTAYFNAIGLRYHLDGGAITHDPTVAPPLDVMHMQPGLPLFAPTFDTLEIYNGLGHSHAEQGMRDWFNFLSMGFTPTGTAVSDSHDPYIRNPGEPRTYVRVEHDRAPLLDVNEVIDNLNLGHAFGTSGPILGVTAHAGDAVASFGELLSPASGAVEVRIHVETPAWYEVSVAEIYITQTYVDEDGDSQTFDLVPTTTVPLAPTELLRGNGGLGLTFDATVPLTDLPATDGWVVVRVRGPGSSQLPVALSGGWIGLNPNATRPEDFAAFAGGEPVAFGNPVFLDRDGNGRYDPPYPLR